MTPTPETKPPLCWNTGAEELMTCAWAIEADDQPDTIERQEAGVYRHQPPRMDWCE